ncbi:MAG: 3'-5' exonuclease, partial [Betaproteobacteria bacterium]|nr:3'-5' exonuclease [Betaproteobacteria bacterium]
MTTNENRIAVDTETGGFESQVETHALLSIAAVASWGCPPFYVKIQPDGLIDPGAAAKNGYTPERWADALPVKVALLEFQRWLHESGAKEKGAVPLAHNAGFDRTWLRHREA